jgi:hypothetical protein
MTRRLPIFLTIILLLAAVPALGQDAKLKAAAESAALEYNYDKFNDFQSVTATVTPKFIFSLAGKMGATPRFMIVVYSTEIGYEDNAIFLIDGRRLTVEPHAHHYYKFTTVLETDDYAAMCEGKSLAVKIGSFEHEFTKAQIDKLANLFKIALANKGA